ncbi:MAG: DUF485 domain-containing protein [Sphingomonadales bacterium]|nr:DUF485 domain-containing protein [Sphingomonadales bacterium]
MDAHHSVASDPRYTALLKRRGRFAAILSAIILIVYFGFIGLVAFNKPLLGASLSGGATSVGIPIGLGIIVLSIALTGLYVRRANGEYDAVLAAIRAEHDA